VGVYQKYFFPIKSGDQNTMFDPQANFRGSFNPLTPRFPRPCIIMLHITPDSARRASDASLSTASSDVNNNDKTVQLIFDPTGMHYWCPPYSLDQVLLVSSAIKSYISNNVFCRFAVLCIAFISPNFLTAMKGVIFLSRQRFRSTRLQFSLLN